MRARDLEDASTTLLAHLSDAISVQWVLSAAAEQLQYTRMARQKASDIRDAVYWLRVAADACDALPGIGDGRIPRVFTELVAQACASATLWAERLEGFPLIWDETRHEVILAAVSAVSGVRLTLQVLIDQEQTAEDDAREAAGPPKLVLLPRTVAEPRTFP